MRCICKSEEPDELTVFRKKQGANYQLFTENQPLYRQVKEQLLDDQKGLCCYCGIRIAADSSHIEHLLDQHKNKALQLDYGNLLTSCNGGNKQEHCGHAKGSSLLPVTPLQEGCEQRFVYRSSGLVDGLVNDVEDVEAKTSIQVLNLNAQRLRNQRKAALASCGLFDDELSCEDIDEYLELYASPDEQGMLEPFSQVIINRLHQERQVLQRQLENRHG